MNFWGGGGLKWTHKLSSIHESLNRYLTYLRGSSEREGGERQNEKGKETLFRGNCFFLCFSRVACGMWQASLGSASNRVEALSDYDNDAEDNDNDASDLR